MLPTADFLRQVPSAIGCLYLSAAVTKLNASTASKIDPFSVAAFASTWSRSDSRARKTFIPLAVFAWMMILCSSPNLALGQNFKLSSSAEQVPSNSYSDPSIVRMQPRTAGSQSTATNPSVQSAQWTGSNPAFVSNDVKPASFEQKAGYSLPFRPDEKKSGESRLKKPTSSWSSTISMFVSLLIVIGLFLLVARIFRNLSPTPQRFLPKEVVQVIGRTPLAPRQQMYLIRFGNKVLLVSQQLGQTTTLSEIENPDEVAHLLGLCEQQSSTSISNSFRDVLQQITLGSTKKATKAPVRNPRTSASQFENLG